MPRRVKRSEAGASGEKKWRCKNAKFHLTYKSHLTQVQKENVYGLFTAKIKQWSFTHENADEEDPYEHTHIYVRLDKPLETENVRFFDIDGIHPNIQFVTDRRHEVCILKYHQKEGNLTLEQIPPYISGEELIAHAAEKDPLDWINMQLEYGGNMGQVSGMLLYQKEAKKRKWREEDEEAMQKFTEFTKPFEENFKCMYVEGPSRLGKSQWALHHFERPLKVHDVDDLKEFDREYHDGIVFDDVNYADIGRTVAISMAEWDMPHTVHCRHSNARIPAETRKIFTSNDPFHVSFPYDSEHGAIRGRFDRFVKITERIFNPIEGPPNIKAAPETSPSATESNEI